MNPNMAFMGGGGGKMPSKIDLRIVALVVAACLAVLFAILGDHAVFVKAPENYFTAALAYATDFGYRLTESRVLAFAMSFAAYFSVLLIIGMIIFIYVEVYIIEPLAVKWRMRYAKREKLLMNKYDDGTL